MFLWLTGAGLYSFAQNYSQDCLDTRNCQKNIADIDSSSSVNIYSLSTIATTYQVSVDGKGIVDETQNVNGLASTVTVWTPSMGYAFLPFVKQVWLSLIGGGYE